MNQDTWEMNLDGKAQIRTTQMERPPLHLRRVNEIALTQSGPRLELQPKKRRKENGGLVFVILLVVDDERGR